MATPLHAKLPQALAGQYLWAWFIGAHDADVLSDLASAEALLGRADDAVATLERAADAGWADVTWLRHDPAFADLRDTEKVKRVCRDAAMRVVLPPPIGSGGLGRED